MNYYLSTGASLLGYMVLSFVTGKVMLKLEGMSLLLFMAVLGSIGIIAAGVWLWFRSRSAPAGGGEGAPAADSGGTDEISLLARDADARLAVAKLAQGGGIRNLPAILLLGDRATTKTSVMTNSGLEAELLAGQVYQENAIVPTRAANFWFARKAVFAELGGKLLAEPQAWKSMIRRLTPGTLKSAASSGQAPRAAIVCFDCENFTKPGAENLVGGAARFMHGRLNEISETLGISFPVYMLFTKADRLPFFADYVRNLTNEEASQVLGATVPMRRESGGVYAEEETARLSAAFNQLYFSIAEKRIAVLPREHDQDRLPGAYEFPREFRKIRTSVVNYLVDLCRPSQLRASPFLRGFYFTGVRPIIVTETVQAQPVKPQPQAMQGAGSATGVFKVPGAQPGLPQAVPVATGTRKVPQWLFLSHLFNDVILRDDAAMGASGASTKTSRMRRILFAASTGLCLLLAVLWLVSYLGNRSLEADALKATRNISSTEGAGSNLASLDSLQKLETLRQSLERLTVYQNEGAPLRLRLGLYAGEAMYPHVRRIYYNKFYQLLLAQTQAKMLAYLGRLPAMPDSGYPYGPTYDTLKGYLITTSNHDKSSRPFLSPLLQNWWIEGRDVDSERQQLARKQFDFYSEDLKRENPFSSDNDAPTVDRARRYLAQFSGTERVYQFMLAEASRRNPTLNFNQRFPGSAALVENHKDVPGAFTKAGWDFMKDAIKHADQFFGGEKWVLGDYAPSAVDRGRLEADLTARYTSDYIAAWRAYINASRIVPYAGLKDAAAKLNQLSGNQSPLLALFWLASQNTGVDSPKVAEAFQPVHQVVPPSQADRYIGPTNQQYMNTLLQLQSSMEQAASAPSVDPAMANATLQNAASARMGTRQVAQAFRIDPEAHIETRVEKLLEDPITNAEALLRGLGPAELNAKGRGLCMQFSAVMAKFPFNPKAQAEATLDEVGGLLRPQTGALWTFYEANLKNMLPKQGNSWVAAPGSPMALNPAFVTFFNNAAHFSEALYHGGQTPRLEYILQPQASDQVEQMQMNVDGQNASFSGPAGGKKFIWPGSGAQELRLSVKLQGGTDLEVQNRQGLWSLFRFFADADQFSPSGHAYGLAWIVRQGREGRPVMVAGKPLTYRFLLDTAGAPPVFSKDYLSNLRCVATVAR